MPSPLRLSCTPRPAALLLASLLLLAASRVRVAAEECVILTNNMVVACDAVSGGLWVGDLPPLKYGDPAVSCAALAEGVDRVYGDGPVVPACCDAARAFSAGGCVCDQDVVDMTEGMGRLPRGTDVPRFMQGVMHLTQASRCALAAHGGPILDACTGTLGPCDGPSMAEPAAI
jgi:hypothetical protein